MSEIETALKELFCQLSERVEVDPTHRENEVAINGLTALKGIDKEALIEIDKAIFLAEMRALEIACREAFLYGISFCNQNRNINI